VKIRYTGPADRVDLAPAAGGRTFPRGEVIEVDDTLGAALVAQATFEAVAEPEPKGRGSAARSNPGVESR
jgi:hypothetical protein